MQDFHQLKVWQKAHELTLGVYRISNTFPRAEEFGLKSQMRRASASIGANIAEGCGRSGRAELAQFLNFAMGSASELEYGLLLARDLRLINAESHHIETKRVVEVKRMLGALLRRLRNVAPPREKGRPTMGPRT